MTKQWSYGVFDNTELSFGVPIPVVVEDSLEEALHAVAEHIGCTGADRMAIHKVVPKKLSSGVTNWCIIDDFCNVEIDARSWKDNDDHE